MFVPLFVGSLSAAAIFVYARVFRFDRSRAFYPTVLIVVASLYVLFAVMGGSQPALIVELAIMGAFFVAATVGHARSQWIVVIGLAAHGVLDAFHGHIIDNPGVPLWWPAFCGSYDLVAAAGLAFLLVRNRNMVAE